MEYRKELCKHIGSMEQLAYAKRVTYQDGGSGKLSAIIVKNGLINFVIGIDKCMDILEMNYKGENIHFMAKGGMTNAMCYQGTGEDGIYSVMGGLFFTCGLENVGPPTTNRVMHGRIRSTKAEEVSIETFWDEERYKIRITGKMRQASLFGNNLVLKRTIETEYGEDTIHIQDEIVNEGYEKAPAMILYHFNIGYPLLREDSKIYIPTTKVTPRDEEAKLGLENYMNPEIPTASRQEEVFYHDMENEEVEVKVANGDRQFALTYQKSELPFFTQWKSMASGDYVMGLEPGNCQVEGYDRELEKGNIEYIEPFATKNIHLKITVK